MPEKKTLEEMLDESRELRDALEAEHTALEAISDAPGQTTLNDIGALAQEWEDAKAYLAEVKAAIQRAFEAQQ